MVGRIPTIPLTEDGSRIEPPVSVPSAPRQVRAATAAPEPPLEPAGKRSGFQGLRQVPWCGLSVVPPQANSCMFVLPTMMAPARLSRAATVASSDGTKSDRIFDPAVVRTPRDGRVENPVGLRPVDRKSTRLNSSHVASSYAVFCS